MAERLNVRDSLDFIEDHLNEKISLDDLAKKACLSKYHYHRLFHQAVGVSLNRYISQKRMDRSAKELIETDQPIIEIALKYQYNSQEAFSRAFKRTYQLAPGQYRKLYADCNKSSILHFYAYAKKITDIAA